MIGCPRGTLNSGREVRHVGIRSDIQPHQGWKSRVRRAFQRSGPSLSVVLAPHPIAARFLAPPVFWPIPMLIELTICFCPPLVACVRSAKKASPRSGAVTAPTSCATFRRKRSISPLKTTSRRCWDRGERMGTRGFLLGMSRAVQRRVRREVSARMGARQEGGPSS